MGTHTFFQFLSEQWTRLPPPLQSDLANKVVMITGANTGIGLEAAKTFAGLHPKKLIVACRSEEKGKATAAGQCFAKTAENGVVHFVFRDRAGDRVPQHRTGCLRPG